MGRNNNNNNNAHVGQILLVILKPYLRVPGIYLFDDLEISELLLGEKRTTCMYVCSRTMRLAKLSLKHSIGHTHS